MVTMVATSLKSAGEDEGGRSGLDALVVGHVCWNKERGIQERKPGDSTYDTTGKFVKQCGWMTLHPKITLSVLHIIYLKSDKIHT